MNGFRQRVFGRPFLPAAVVPLLLLGAARGEDAPSLTGVWKLKVERKQAEPRETVVYFLQEGDKVLAKESPRGRVFRGTVKDGKVTFRIPVGGADSANQMMTLTGKLREKRLTGVVQVNGQEYEWSGLSLASVWACDHRDPVHTATSEQQIRDLTRKYKCRGWHRIGAAEAVRLIHRRSDKEDSDKDKEKKRR